MGRDREDLDPSSGTATLAAGSAPVTVLSASARGAQWRLIDLQSLDDLPFEVSLHWDARPHPARVTVPKAALVCVWCAQLRVQALTYTSVANKVSVGVATAMATTENSYESHQAGPVASFEVPAFARAVRVDCSDRALFAGLVIELRTQGGAVFAQYQGDTQPADGIPLGTATTIVVTAAGAAELRATFHLTL